ncbi:MAG: discoidin domain-containing protein [Candidatus Omnitrophota bacterium]
MSKLGIFSVLAVLSLACVSPAEADDEWKASASSVEEKFTPELAVDGDISTRWSSQFADNQWWSVDFGAQKDIKKITIVWEDAYPAVYKVLVSPDGKAWQAVFENKNGKGGSDIIPVNSIKARYLKVEMAERATQWGNSIRELKLNEPDPIKAKASASSGDSDYSAQKAIDGDMQSRWSSNFEDNQWWQADLDSPHKICGVMLKWETAFTEIYNIEIKDSSGKWRKVYETSDGDGSTDIVYFDPVEATALKINCVQRGTGWGNSLWEVSFLDGNNPPVISGDGKIIDIKLPSKADLGGVVLSWADNYAKEYALEISRDGKDFKEIYKTADGNGGKDLIYFKASPVKEFRIKCIKPASGNRCDIKGFEPKSGEEQATPIKIYQALAKESPAGYYPMWLRRLQEFWTVTGVPDSDNEGLFTETGTFEPYKDGFSLMPFVYDGSKLYTAEDCRVSQALADGYLPIPSVAWDHSDWSLEITALSARGSETSLRYVIRNTGKAQLNGKLFLAIRPVQVNPIWQRGGFSPINKIECKPPVLSINGRDCLVSATEGVSMGAADLSKGDAVDFMKKGGLPPSLTADSAEGTASAGLSFDVAAAPGEANTFIVQMPAGKLADFDSDLSKQKSFWKNELSRVYIDIPETRITDVMRTNIAYILINKDGPWIKPGSRNYNHSWIRDGALTSAAVLRMGINDEVKQWLDAVASKVMDNGYVPYIVFEGGNPIGLNDNGTGEGVEWDSQGEFVFAVRNYVDYSGDKGYLPSIYPKVVKALEFTRDLRRRNMTEEFKKDPKKMPYYGVLPKSNSHEGYYPAQTSYWDDFFAIRGFKDGIYLAELMNDAESAEWMREELDDFRKCLYESIRLVVERDRLDYIPGCVEKGDFDATSTAIGIVAAGELEYMPKELLKKTFDKYYADFVKGMVPGKERTFTPYEVRSANAFFKMDQRDRGLTMLRYFLKDSVRPYGWNHMAEVVHAKVRAPSYIGDMPHTWVGSGYIDAVRTMFVYEDDGKLILGAGLAPEWFEKGIEVRDMPTLYGKICYKIIKKGDKIEYFLYGNAKPPKGVKFVLPKELRDCVIEEMKAGK